AALTTAALLAAPAMIAFGSVAGASTAYAEAPAISMGNLYQSAVTTVNPQVTDAVTSTGSGRDWDNVPDPTMRHPHRGASDLPASTAVPTQLGARSAVDVLTNDTV
ncbi:MAG: hypothetical protein ACOYD1_13540, partial [Candidatus Nanopelagicales bacterium]